MNLINLLIPAARQKLAGMARDEKITVLRIVGQFSDILASGDHDLITALLDQYTDDPKIRDLILSEFVYEGSGK